MIGDKGDGVVGCDAKEGIGREYFPVCFRRARSEFRHVRGDAQTGAEGRAGLEEITAAD